MKPYIDFSITSDIYHLTIIDSSFWDIIENQPAIIEIYLPGARKPVTKYFDKNRLNVFNSFALELNCYDECTQPDPTSLPDGIYTIKVTGSPSTFCKERLYLKTDIFQSEFNKFLITMFEQDFPFNYEEELIEIKLLLAGASAYIQYTEPKKSSALFDLAIDKLEKLKTKCHGMQLQK